MNFSVHIYALEMLTTTPRVKARLYGQNWSFDEPDIIGLRGDAHLMSCFQHFVVDTLNFDVHGQAKSGELVRCTKRDASMDYSPICHFFLSLLSCYELNGAKETTL